MMALTSPSVKVTVVDINEKRQVLCHMPWLETSVYCRPCTPALVHHCLKPSWVADCCYATQR